MFVVWDTLVCQPHPCSHILRSTHEFAAYTMNVEHQKKLSAFRFRNGQEAQFVPTGIPILQFASKPNGIVTHASQRIHCNRLFAKQWRIRPPGLNLGCPAPLSAKHRDFSHAAGLQLLQLTSLKDQFKLCLVQNKTKFCARTQRKMKSFHDNQYMPKFYF